MGTPLPSPLNPGDYTNTTYDVGGNGPVTIAANNAFQGLFFDTGSVIEDVQFGATIDTYQHSGNTGISFLNGGELLADLSGGYFSIGSDTEHQLAILGTNDSGPNLSPVTSPGQIVVTNLDTLHIDLRGFVNDGVVTVNGGTLQLATAADPEPIKVSGTGAVTIENTGFMEINASVGSGQTFSFAGTGNTLQLDDVSSTGAFNFGATITGTFAKTDRIVLHGQTAATAVDSGNVLTVMNGTTLVASIATSGSFGPLVVTEVGSDAVITLACFAAGTRLTTARGEIAVEALVVGDQVATASGAFRPVRWLGHRLVDCVRHPQPADVWPIHVRADAFGPGVPRTSVFLSPDHAVFVDGVLIPVRHLVNGTTIAAEARDAMTYWHVELDEHDVVLAEGLPSESYLETGNRTAFENAGPLVDLVPDFARRVWDGLACADLVVAGPVLNRVRQTLAARATMVQRARKDVQAA